MNTPENESHPTVRQRGDTIATFTDDGECHVFMEEDVLLSLQFQVIKATRVDGKPYYLVEATYPDGNHAIFLDLPRMNIRPSE